MSKEKQIEAKVSITDLPCLQIGQKQCWCEVSCEDCIESHVLAAGYRKQSEGEWISVDERLPESGVHCLISCTVKRINGTHGQYICVGYYAEKFKHLAYGVDDDCVSEYNEEDDEFYISEGWYEVIKNWDDYGFVAIDDSVTHWMPLPEPPVMKGGAE
jgi:hypothetical protein